MRTCEVNEFLTPIEQLELEKYPEEIQTLFWDFVDNVPFIKWLISPNRPRAKDLPRDEQGRIIVDITKPHILEDMDYFRQPAIHFKKTGRYTDLKPNPNPNSQYMKWLKEEIRRCWHGYVRESDGEWVTGNMYFYMNYYRMEITEELEDKQTGKKKKKGNRRVDFPDTWEGIYWRYHYIELALNGGLFNDWEGGESGCEISSRGRGKSHCMAAMIDKYFMLGESEEVRESVKSLVVSASSEFLDADGILNKFNYANEFAIQRNELLFPKRRIKSSMKDMEWKSGYVDLDTKTEKGTLNQVFGVTTGDNGIGKIRGKRMQLIVVEEFGSFPSVLEMYNIMKPSWIEGDTAFGFCYMIGTTGEKESDFAGASEIVYNPKGYRMYGLPNNWDLTGLGRSTITFFFPGYINYKGHYNHDGVSDVTASLLKILITRYDVKYNTTDINSITRTIAEIPITPQEALLRVRASMFPVAQLNERVNQLDNDPSIFDDVYIGDLVINKSGNVEFTITKDEPIRSFPHDANNKQRGALEIFQMPQKDAKGDVVPNRYILSCLPKGELVNTDRGLVPIEDITLNDKLVNFNGEFVNIINLQNRYYDNDIYNIKLSTIYDSTSFTYNHPIYCATPEVHYHNSNIVKKTGLPSKYYKYDFGFRQACNVKVGDIVRAPNTYHKVFPFYDRWIDNERIDHKIKNPLHTEDFWWMIGLLLGDGWACNNGYSINCSFNITENLYILKFINIVHNVFHRKVQKTKSDSSCSEYTFSCKEFNKFFSNNFGKGAKNKHIPEWVKFIDPLFKKLLILGYLASDGSVTNNNIEFVSISKKLLNDFQDILFSLGISCGVTLLRKSQRVFLFGKYRQQQEAYHLRIAKIGAYNIKQWNNSDLKLSKITYLYNSDNAKHDIRNTWFSDNLEYIYIKVLAVNSRHYSGNVYNFECDTHTFMCNYVPTHNCDPIDQDSSETMSLYSIFVLDLFTDEIVAEYTGRPMFADEGHELLRKLCIFYNGKCCYEQNLKGIYAYFQKTRCLHLLCDTPQYLKDKGMAKTSTYGNTMKGILATVPINNYANQLTRDWLLKPVIMHDKDGNEQMVAQLYKVKNRAFLKECILYTPHINVDRIRSFGLLMLYRLEFIVLYEGDIANHAYRDTSTDPNYAGNDDFFKKNYTDKFKNKELNTFNM